MINIFKVLRIALGTGNSRVCHSYSRDAGCGHVAQGDTQVIGRRQGKCSKKNLELLL